MTIVVFIIYTVFFEASFQKFCFVFSNLEFIAYSVRTQILIVSKQLQLFDNYATKYGWSMYQNQKLYLIEYGAPFV